MSRKPKLPGVIGASLSALYGKERERPARALSVGFVLRCPGCGSHNTYNGFWPDPSRFLVKLWSAFWKDHRLCKRPKIAPRVSETEVGVGVGEDRPAL